LMIIITPSGFAPRLPCPSLRSFASVVTGLGSATGAILSNETFALL
jgi:hypothetical protein